VEWSLLLARGDCGAKETILVKDPNLAHIPRIIANGDIFPDVRGQDERKILGPTQRREDPYAIERLRQFPARLPVLLVVGAARCS
jgi:hypothetical protein